MLEQKGAAKDCIAGVCPALGAQRKASYRKEGLSGVLSVEWNCPAEGGREEMCDEANGTSEELKIALHGQNIV